MQTEEILELLSQKVNHRIDIYSAPSKIDNYFKDEGFLSNELIRSNTEAGETGANFLQIFSVKVTNGIVISEEIILDAKDKLKIIEKISQKDIESRGEDNDKQKNLFNFKGPAHFTLWNEKLELYSSEQNELIQKEMERQESIFNKKSVIFTFVIDEIIYVSIANKDKFDLDMLASYGSKESHGILGLIERKLSQNIILINPFWIWHEC
jgi:hypothetical protein